VKIVAISDSHGLHKDVMLPKGDLLIHAGDVSNKGSLDEIQDFLQWFSVQEFEHKIFIAGNHDFYFEKSSTEDIANIIPDNVIYLNDSGVTINDIKIWGSPITPFFFNWAFNRNRGKEIEYHWSLIPDDTGILITHGPAFRRLDKNTENSHVGCKDLFLRIQELQVKAHVFGHIHEAYGTLQSQDTHFYNASLVNEDYQFVNRPIVFEL